MQNESYTQIYHYWHSKEGLGLSLNECFIYGFIRDHTFNYECGSCRGERYISDKLELNRGTVRAAIERLEELKLITAERKGKHKSTIFQATNKDVYYNPTGSKSIHNIMYKKCTTNKETGTKNEHNIMYKNHTSENDTCTKNVPPMEQKHTSNGAKSYHDMYRNHTTTGTEIVHKNKEVLREELKEEIIESKQHILNESDKNIINNKIINVVKLINPKTEQEEQQIIFEYCMVQCILNQNFKTDNPELTEFCKVFRKENEARFGSDSIKNTMNSITNYDCKQSVEHLKTNLLTAKDKQSIIRFYYFVDEYFDLIEQEKQAIKNRDEELRIKVFTDSGMSREEAIEFLKKGEDDDRIRIEINNQQD